MDLYQKKLGQQIKINSDKITFSIAEPESQGAETFGGSRNKVCGPPSSDPGVHTLQ